MKKKEVLIVLGLILLVVGGIFAYFKLAIKVKEFTPPKEVDKCDQETVTKLVINTDKRPAFVEDWVYCFGKKCMPASEFLKECNSKQVSLQGKLDVGEICPSCSPVPCGCIVIADLFGIVLHQIDDGVKKEFKDTKVYIEGILHWKGSGYGPTLDVTKVKRAW